MKVLELKETNSAKAILIGSEVYRKSQFGGKHPLSIPRVSAVLDLVRALGICDKEEYKTGPCAKPELLKSFHTADYIDCFKKNRRCSKKFQKKMQKPIILDHYQTLFFQKCLRGQQPL